MILDIASSGGNVNFMSSLSQGFNHHILRGFKYYWSLTGLSEIKKYLFALGNEEKVRFVEDFIDIFERDVLANEPFFSKCRLNNSITYQVTPLKLK